MGSSHETLSDEQLDVLKHSFGSIGLSNFMLFQAVTGGENWIEYYEVVELLGNLYAAIFVVFIFFFLYAVLNIITSVFVDRAFRLAMPDLEEHLFEKRAQDHQDVERLLEAM